MPKVSNKGIEAIIYSLQKQDHSLSNSNHRKQQTIFYCSNNNLKANPICILLIELFKLTYVLHAAAVYLLLSASPTSNWVSHMLQDIKGQATAYRMFQVLVYLNKILMAGCVCCGKSDSKQGGILKSISINVLIHFHLIAQFDLALSSFLMLVSLPENAVSFLLSAALNLFSNLYLENYVDRRDPLYCISSQSNFIFRCIILSIVLTSTIFLQINNIYYFSVAYAIMSFVTLFWYFWIGHNIYIHKIIKYSLLLFISLIVEVALACIETTYLFQEFITVKTIARYSITAAVMIFSLVIFSNKPIKIEKDKDLVKYSIKQIDLHLSSALNGGQSNINEESWMLGMFNIHEQNICQNSNCSTQHDLVYDPIMRTKVFRGELKRQKQSSLRFYLRCLYQKAIKQNPADIDLQIDFCEFIVSEFSNASVMSSIIIALLKHNLNGFQRIKLYKLKKMMKEQSDNFNKSLFDGKLDLEEIITAQEHYEQITSGVQELISKNLKIWQMVRRNAVNMTELRQSLKECFGIVDLIYRKWGNISKYLNIQRKQYYFYLNYCFFILNEKIKYKESNDDLEEDNIFENNYHITQVTDHQLRFLINQNVLFDNNSFYIRAFIQNQKMFVSKVSKSFEKIVGYQPSEMAGGHLETIMNDQIKETHNQKVMKWLESGQSVNEDSYPIILTNCITKSGATLPVIKYYKMFLNLFSPHVMQFVCLLKINRDERKISVGPRISHRSNRISVDDIQEHLNSKPMEVPLKNQNNIFLKEDNLQPKQVIKQIVQIKQSMRMLTFTLLILILALSFVTHSDAEGLQNYSTQYLNFLNMYRFPMALVKNYMKLFMKVGNQTKVVNQIGSATKQFLSFASAPLTLKTLFDSTLNIPKQYYPFKNNSFNKGLPLNQIDLFYLMVSSISSLSKLPLNRTGYDFNQLNSYLKPSYDNLINSTKYQFHISFQGIFDTMHTKQMVIGLFQSLVFIITMVFIYYKVYSYFRKMRQAMKIIIEFNTADMKKISNYWILLQYHFERLSKNEIDSQEILVGNLIKKSSNLQSSGADTILTTIAEQNLDTQEEFGLNMNKRTKNIYLSSQQQKQTRKIIAIITVSMLLVIFIVLGIEIYSFAMISKLKDFQMAGFYFLQYYPATSILGHALLEKYYSVVYPAEVTYYPERFADSVQAMRLIGDYSYIGSISDESSLYFQKQKNYFFGNPCTFNPDVLLVAETTLLKCQTISNRTFNSGISTYIRMGHKQVWNYLNGRQNMTVTELDELTTSLTLTAYYITDAISTWSDEFTTKIYNFEFVNQNICIFVGVLLFLLHITVCECLMFRSLQKDYDFMQKVFNNMIPQYILTTEKVIKQKFIMEGIIRNQ